MIDEIQNFGISWNDIEPVVNFKSSEDMGSVGDDTVDLVVTSPPYGTIKDYGCDGQIGFGASIFEYYVRMKKVIEECRRVLKFGSRMVINVGDQYVRKGESSSRYKIIPISYKITSMCVDMGFEFLGDIIWKKVSTTNSSGGCSFMGSLFYPRKGIVTYDYEHILVFRNVSGKKQEMNKELREYSKISIDEWKKWFVGHWNISPARQEEHVAMFPEELPYRIIRMFSVIGDIVLDPFTGSGTTLKVAKSLMRRSIGFELNKGFGELIRGKIAEASPFLFPDHQMFYNIILSSGMDVDFDFSIGRGVICVKGEGGKRAVLDFVTFPAEFDVDKKSGENNFSNFERGKGDWSSISMYVVVLNSNMDDVVGKVVTRYKKDMIIVTLGLVVSGDVDLFELIEWT